MYTTTTTLFDDNDVEVTFNLDVHRKGLLKTVVVDWAYLDAKYIGPEDITISGVRVKPLFEVGFINDGHDEPENVIYTTEEEYWWTAESFIKSFELSQDYDSNRVYVAGGDIEIFGKDNASKQENIVELPVRKFATGSIVNLEGAIKYPLIKITIYGTYIRGDDVGMWPANDLFPSDTIFPYVPNSPIYPLAGDNEQQIYINMIEQEKETPVYIGDNFLMSLPNGVRDTIEIDSSGAVKIIKKVGYTRKAATDHIQGQVGNNIISSTDKIEDDVDVYYQLDDEYEVELPSIVMPTVANDYELVEIDANIQTSATIEYAVDIRIVTTYIYDTRSSIVHIEDNVFFRQHGDTESWGSSNKKDLFFPWQNIRN